MSKHQFNIWCAEHQAWLARDTVLSHFLSARLYPTWQFEEQNPCRIAAVVAANPDLPQNASQNQTDILTTKRFRQGLVFLSQVAKYFWSYRPMLIPDPLCYSDKNTQVTLENLKKQKLQDLDSKIVIQLAPIRNFCQTDTLICLQKVNFYQKPGRSWRSKVYIEPKIIQ